jgi:hypothetical protein
MTFDDLRAQVCSKVGQIDSTSLSLCGDYLNSRYQMIYDSENWQDTLDFATAPTVIGESVIAIPDALERVVSVRYGQTWLEEVDIPFLLELGVDLTQTGTPKYYTEYGGGHSIKLFPVPDAAITVTFFGKKTFARLSLGDSPIIRNIDNCLLAFTQGDMLQRARQYAKAKECVEEAGALLEQLRKLEKAQSNLPRRSKNITVRGDSLEEMTDAVSCRVGDYSAPSQIMIKEYLRRNYIDIYDSHLWPESTVIARMQRDGSEVVLPEYFGDVVSVRQNVGLPELEISDQNYFFGIDPQVFERSGSPVSYAKLTPVGVAVLPPFGADREQLTFVSSDATDKSDIFIRFEVNGIELSETVTLNGTTPVFSVNLVDTPLTVAKGLTAGYVDVTTRITSTFLVRLGADERELKHIRLWLVPTPVDSDGTECLILGKRRIKPLLTNEDTPILSGLGNVLIFMATADFLSRAGDEKSALAATQKATSSLQLLIDRATKQSAYEPRVIPYAEGSACDFNWL